MAFNFPYQQQYDYMDKLVKACKKKGFAKETTTALSVNAYHESYLNPYVIEGAINPGPPLGANGWDDGHSGGGLWQWTPFAGKIKLGDFDGQVNYMESDVGQWNIYGTWFGQAGLADPTPKIESFNDFLHNTKGYDDTALTRAFIGYWERPAYSAGTVRYNNASTEAPQFRELVDKYWGADTGGNPSNGSPGGGGTDGGTKPSANTDNSKVGLSSEVLELVNKFLGEYEKALTKNVKLSSNSKYHFNSKVKLTPLYPDTFRIKMTNEFEDALKKMIDDASVSSNLPKKDDTADNTTPAPKPDEGSTTPSANATYAGIINWCKANLGKSYNYIASHPSTSQPQCVDMIKAVAEHYINNANLTKCLYGTGNAQDIYHTSLAGTGWKQVAGDIYNDANATKIWNSLPNGCIVFYQYSTFGHVGIKAGDADLCYQQNYNGQGFISLDNDMAFRTYTGAGFLGAWVME